MKEGFDDIERRPRMADYLRAEDMDTGACVWLAETVLSDAGESLTNAARRAAEHPTRDNLSRLVSIRRWYESDWFGVLSCGVVDGKTAARKIIRDALIGRKVRAAL